MKILLLLPPMTQINTPYPATAYLTGFLRGRGFDVEQADPAIELFSKLFCRDGLTAVFERLRQGKPPRSPSVQFFMQQIADYQLAVDPALDFLRGRDPSLALRIVGREFLPEGPRFASLNELQSLGDNDTGYDPLTMAFGDLGVADRAKYMASLFVNDLGDVIRDGIDPRFEMSRYAEKLAASAPTFEGLQKALGSKPTLVDEMLESITKDLLEKHKPTVVGLTVPFPGNVYGAFRMAKTIRSVRPEVKIVLGGGYVNTELRSLAEPVVFDYVDYICLDDGERPLLSLLDHISGNRGVDKLQRTFIREGQRIVFKNNPGEHDIPHKDAGIPTYSGLPLDKYVSILEMLNPMHRIWSDGRWNKITLAHGCYWKQCKFCDISLDYIGRYDPAGADLLIDRIESIVKETSQRGFHFVDEAAPPQVLFSLAKRLLERKVAMTWWGNIRFEKSFNAKTVPLLAKSGCVAVSGGLEVASDRLLKMMNKGVTVEQVARVTHAFTQSGILVHAYLMYGFPTQTEQETIDSLERVRQLFAEGCIQSGYWHRFSATVHSPIGMEPDKYGIKLLNTKPAKFANNDVAFEDPTGCDHDRLGAGLRKALYNYMLGIGLDEDVRFWFDFKVPKAKVPRTLVADALKAPSA
ncbi:MAG: radical SAM protein [Oligoflexales bacterium]